MNYYNPSTYLFMFMLFMGTMMTISANSWLATWMGLEINLLSFIPLISNPMNMFSSEAALYYFIIQAIASSLFLFTIMTFSILEKNSISMSNNLYNMISLMLFMKLGAAPFHFWLPKVMEGLNWMNCFILITWQKIAPFSILIFLMKHSIWFHLISISSIMVGAIGGINQTSLRKIMAYSSINHIGWMILALQFNNSIWLIYFIIYSLMNFPLMSTFYYNQTSHLNQFLLNNSSQELYYKFFISMSLFSLSGLPPFIGFLPKWLIIESLQMYSYSNLIILILIISSILTLFYYLRIIMKILLFFSTSNKWNIKMHINLLFISTSMFSLSILGLPLMIFIFNFI
uniref:NADH-ubiquinone oxidoreductase chain 2 n=1 Tax=Ornebius bimaculatus TaxID=2153490 RepID=A0A385I1Y8_9ORTH|nr:NADH dehydrogenase subunit 2 [Ornebius bimaculatus]AXY63924.1 NADH dehydrogenase subunit 2 [Ornebius bimaculatus]